ncbi:dynein regulatory complex subunit 2-like [Plodia interpunctella]|uniref:dynein regulatory complex subunit 2-like n=1 Tax=Plodia interpunctella TaxID=58824 RepID=UPI002368DCAB|nr:dynein regulatory complex subunit 2-like [Plodia interpunctella]
MALTKEEKKAKKEQKRLEKLKAEEELRKKLKREALEREIAAQALKRDEVDKTWREMMLKIKEPVFKQDIEVMWHTFERAYDKQDHLINYTIKLMNIADDQFQRTVASFCDTIDTMINKFLADLEALSKDNDIRTAALLKMGEDDFTQIMTDHNTAETHLQLLIFHGHSTADTLAWTTRGENLVKEDEERTKYLDERENLRSFLEDNYNAMWDEYKAVLKAYVLDTADNQKQVRKLRRKENLMADIIASQGKKIANSDGLLKRLRTELAAYESGTKQAVFRDRRNRHRAACFRLKQALINGVTTDVNQLAVLVKESDTAVEWLEQAAKKGEKILRMGALCRKFETLREKVLPYGSHRPHSPTSEKDDIRRQISLARLGEDSLVTNAIATTSGLSRMWQRVANAELGKRALFREKMLLEHENAMIMRKLREMKDSSITPDPGLQCICSKAPTNKTINRPNAVDGPLSLLKYKKR